MNTDEQGSRPDDEETLETLYDQLDSLIQRYVKKSFADKGLEEKGDYIGSWSVVVNYGNLNYKNPAAAGYLVESMPLNSPPHAIKGLLREGIDWVIEQQDGAFEDDEDI